MVKLRKKKVKGGVGGWGGGCWRDTKIRKQTDWDLCLENLICDHGNCRHFGKWNYIYIFIHLADVFSQSNLQMMKYKQK